MILLEIFKVKVAGQIRFNFCIHEFLLLREKVISILNTINLCGKRLFGGRAVL
jgi:hypothetical protein